MPPPPPFTKFPPSRSAIPDDEFIHRLVHMDADMIYYLFKTATEATKLHKSDGEISAYMKGQFELMYGKKWHCVVNEETTPDSPEWCGVMYANIQRGLTQIIIYKMSATAGI